MNLGAFVKDKIVHIPTETDARFRRALMEAVAQDGGREAYLLILTALANGPDREGSRGAIRYFGNGLEVKLRLTAQVVDGIEISVPGFKKWLEMTGFGNDTTMIRGFIAWAERKAGLGRVITGVKEIADRHG